LRRQDVAAHDAVVVPVVREVLRRLLVGVAGGVTTCVACVAFTPPRADNNSRVGLGLAEVKSVPAAILEGLLSYRRGV
jgi:hypothetical protein